MMSKTHITVGIATALAVAHGSGSGVSVALLAVAGGALGGVAPDIDILDDDYHADALIGQLIAVGLTGLVIGVDVLFSFGVIESILKNKPLALVGLVAYIVLAVICFSSVHRSFSHSIIAMMLFSIAAGLIYFPFAPFFLAGYLSHLLIDLLNKKGIQLLFPLKWRTCLKICYANQSGNKVLMYFGLAASIVLLVTHLAT